jgi:pimeloyl-ACP methyl ester carboxylesterase
MRRFLTARRPGWPGSSAVFISLAVVAAGLAACGHTPTQLGAQGKTDLSFATGNWSIRPSATLHWQRCPGRLTIVRCARLTVPLDYAKPHGRTIALALDEFPATAPAGQRLGPLLVNPGGPGQSGLEQALTTKLGLPRAVASRYDIIGFDTRGVGHSQPQLHCDPSFFTGPQPPDQPASPAAERAQVRRARSYAAGCEQRSGWLLPHMTTADSARDLDAIRAALGVPKISYLGYSWGTYLGEVYATLFPGHVRRMVLDSVVGPSDVWYRFHQAQLPALQARLTAFFAWTAQHDKVYRLGRTEAAVAAQYQLARRRLAAHPVEAIDGTAIGPDGLDSTVMHGAGYANLVWPVMASMLADYLHGNGGSAFLARLYGKPGSAFENMNAVFSAVQCSDVAWPRSWARWDADTRRAAVTAPWLAWDNTWFNAPCAFWPVRGPARPMKIGAAGLPGILMLQGTLDGGTPYAGALEARRALPSGRLVAVTGSGNHGQSVAIPPDACVNGYLSRYLAAGALPSGTGLVSATCAAPQQVPAVRVPVPPASTAPAPAPA